ncbi:dipeptide epimerase [Breznakiella homolactica]|uniref:Dipeptide epimerase n=1 Tax=Breznakiella homolactica TaxID=2798577 RepID=A0A7T7XJM5_9SPIR|nr:dipeptide epimerase [Breznakiella homolactica]QQO07510.1 dipeptide epimerase [Breznakiella homolactica]
MVRASITAALWHRKIPLKKPFVTALRCVDTVDDLVLKLSLGGYTGYGSAAPTVRITGDSAETIADSVKHELFPLFAADFDPRDPGGALRDAGDVSKSARYMAETALFDLAGSMQGLSLADMLGGARRRVLTNDITISMGTPQEMARDAADAAAQGFRNLKLKVGSDPETDYARLEAISRSVPDSVRLRVDANQAWDAEEGIAILKEYKKADFPIDFIEQPVPAEDIGGMARLTEANIFPIAADESVFSAADAERLMREKAAHIFNIKLAKCGGITEALAICALAEDHNARCMIGCMMEGPFGILAACQIAAARDPIHWIDLDSPLLYRGLEGVFSVAFYNERITVGNSPGIGIIDPALERWEGEKIWEAG